MYCTGVIEALSSEGKGIMKQNGKVIFVYKAFPGDVVTCQILKNKKNYAEAKLIEVVKSSSYRVEPKCIHLPYCGGCLWQELDYTYQLKAKENRVKDAFLRIGKLDVENKISPILASPLRFHYRNKVDFSFSPFRWLPHLPTTPEEYELQNAGGIGFHVRGAWDKVLHIETCWLIPPILNEIKSKVYQLAKQFSIPFYNPATHNGELRNLVLRYSFATEEVMSILISAKENPFFLNHFVSELKRSFPQISSYIFIENTKLNDYYQDLPYKVLEGKEWIEESLSGKRYRIYPTAFFQVNSRSAQLLFDYIKRALPSGIERVADLYCGTGTILISIADQIEKGLGIEMVPSALRAAKENARLNGFTHLEFREGDLQRKETVANLITFTPDLVIVDPPRSGLSKLVRRTLKQILPPHLIYVSCNPATIARDLSELANYFQIEIIQPIDQFPHTPHVEVVAICKRRDKQ